MPDDTPDIDYLNFEIRSENPGIRNLQALVQKLPPRPPSSLGHPTIIVLVPGFSAWGQPFFGALNYFGGYSDLAALVAEGFVVIQARLGPVSSNLERACELFQQLANINANGNGTGFDRPGTPTTPLTSPPTLINVNYGKLPLHPSIQPSQPSETWQAIVHGNLPASWTWSTTNKVTFICHSQGGTTVRYLLYLLSGAVPSDLPPLTTSDEQARVKAVITLGTPHQGTTITNLVRSYLEPDPDRNAVVDFITTCSFAPRQARVYDLGLDQWGFNRSGQETYRMMRERIAPAVVAWYNGERHGLHDNSIPGADALNKLTATVNRPPTYFFSMGFCATAPFPNRSLTHQDIKDFIRLLPGGKILNLLGFSFGAYGFSRFLNWVRIAPSLQQIVSWITGVANRHLRELNYFSGIPGIPRPGEQVPRPDMLPLLAPSAYGMAGIKGGDWTENDGIVNTISMSGPSGDGRVRRAQDFLLDFDLQNPALVQGPFWYFGENSTIDHADQLGIFTDRTTNTEVEVMYKLFAELADRLP